MVTFLGMGQVDIGLMPYTSFMALYDAGAPVKIVAGGGVEGCAIVARPASIRRRSSRARRSAPSSSIRSR
jgi:ABC-type nitrate/sulfonate/bicarbonate transport system substrate-binding protein